MLVEVRNRCSDFDSYRAARVKSLFNAESGANFSLEANLPFEDEPWSIGVVVGPSGSGKTSLGRLIFGGEEVYREVADETSLKYLPHSSEIAGSVLFFASDLSKPVTGQSLDVNCGHWMAP